MLLHVARNFADARAILHNHIQVDLDLLIADPHFDPAMRIVLVQRLGYTLAKRVWCHAHHAVGLPDRLCGNRGDRPRRDLDLAGGQLALVGWAACSAHELFPMAGTWLASAFICLYSGLISVIVNR